MAIYGIGAYYDGEDVSEDFIADGIIGTGWTNDVAPELHNYFTTLKVGDIVYIKAAAFGSADISVKGIGIIVDNIILNIGNHRLTQIGRNVRWLSDERFTIPRPTERNNVRSNTVYEEFHPLVYQQILQRL